MAMRIKDSQCFESQPYRDCVFGKNNRSKTEKKLSQVRVNLQPPKKFMAIIPTSPYQFDKYSSKYISLSSKYKSHKASKVLTPGEISYFKKEI